MIKVDNEVNIYEDHGQEVPLGNKRLHVESHWNRNEMVVLTIGEERVTVSAKDLEAAIANARNSARF